MGKTRFLWILKNDHPEAFNVGFVQCHCYQLYGLMVYTTHEHCKFGDGGSSCVFNMTYVFEGCYQL